MTHRESLTLAVVEAARALSNNGLHSCQIPTPSRCEGCRQELNLRIAIAALDAAPSVAEASVRRCYDCGSEFFNEAGAEVLDELETARTQRDRWRKNFLTVADAVAPESSSPEILASIARQTRADLAECKTALDALERLRFDRQEHVEELRGACDEKQEAIEQLMHDLAACRQENEAQEVATLMWKDRALSAETRLEIYRRFLEDARMYMSSASRFLETSKGTPWWCGMVDLVQLIDNALEAAAPGDGGKDGAR